MALFLELDNEETGGFQGAITFQALLHLPKEYCDSQEYLVFPKHNLEKEREVLEDLEEVKWENTGEHIDAALGSKRKSLIRLALGRCSSQAPPLLHQTSE